MRATLPATGPGGRSGHLVIAVAAIAACYLALAYMLLPAIWTRFEDARGLTGLALVTRTAQGIPGDPLNIAVIGSRGALDAAMRSAGWAPADPLTWGTGAEIVDSVLLDRPYRDAPVSALFYDGRPEDLAYERAAGRSAERRHHVRFWIVEHTRNGAPLWLGAASFDRGVGLSLYTGALTHVIAPDIDAERDLLVADLRAGGTVSVAHFVPGIGATGQSRNGEGSPYRTDGRIALVVLGGPGAYLPVAAPAP